MKKLTAAQTKSITNAKDQVKAAANVMIETPLELIKCILLKHETAVIEVMKELHDEKMRLQQQRDELLTALEELQLRYTTLFNLYAPTHYHPSSNYTSDLDLALATSNAALAKLGADKGEK